MLARLRCSRPFQSRTAVHLHRHRRPFLLTAATMATLSKTVAAYGTWTSPITADLLTKKNVSFGEIVILSKDATQAEIAFVENRPEEGGRAALVKRTIRLDLLDEARRSNEDGQNIDLTQGHYNVRSGVHEYGGGAVASFDDGGAVFTDYNTFGVFTVNRQGSIRKLTSDNKSLRYGDFSKHPTLPLLLAILEDHTVGEPSKVVNTLVLINTESSAVHTVASGYDFYTNPRFSPDGQYVAWVAWNHPSMPFWATELWVAKLETDPTASDPRLTHATKVCGNNSNEVAHHPLWADSRTLYFARDSGGYSNPWKAQIEGGKSVPLSIGKLEPLLSKPVKGDFISPSWSLGGSSFALLSSEWLVAIVVAKSFSSINLLHLPTGTIKQLETPFVDLGALHVIGPSMIVFEGTEPSQPSSLTAMDLREVLNERGTRPRWKAIKRSSTVVDDGVVSPEYVPVCESIEFPTELPNGKKAYSHALLYLPSNPEFVAPAGTAPPCIMKIHGGPTAVSAPGMNLGTSYWTSRGYAICRVNYGGSTSFGREFMERLNGQWGVVDVRDTVAAATYLGSADHGEKDEKASRRIDSAGQSQFQQLEEKRLPNGMVQFILKKATTWTEVLGDAVLGFAFGTASMVTPHFDVKASLAVGSLAALIRHVTRVRQESVMAIPNVGLQLTTVRGFTLPRLRVSREARSPTLVTISAVTKLVPRDTILDIVTKEAIRRWKVIDFLGVATTTPRSSSNAEKASPGQGGQMHVLFPNLLPRLPVVEHVYRSIYPVVFGDAVKLQGAATFNANVDVPPRVDPRKIAISGSSAGGYTVLAALCLYPHAFGAGADYYGVSSIAGLAAESHKFESHYVDQLMGGPPDVIPDVYHDRSPIYMADRIRSPLLIMQGEIDKVVPPEQNQAIYKVLKDKGRKTKYIEFEGEGHGFRMAQNIKRSLEEEQAWYRDVFSL